MPLHCRLSDRLKGRERLILPLLARPRLSLPTKTLCVVPSPLGTSLSPLTAAGEGMYEDGRGFGSHRVTIRPEREGRTLSPSLRKRTTGVALRRLRRARPDTPAVGRRPSEPLRRRSATGGPDTVHSTRKCHRTEAPGPGAYVGRGSSVT